MNHLIKCVSELEEESSYDGLLGELAPHAGSGMTDLVTSFHHLKMFTFYSLIFEYV